MPSVISRAVLFICWSIVEGFIVIFIFEVLIVGSLIMMFCFVMFCSFCFLEISLFVVRFAGLGIYIFLTAALG